VRIRYENNAGEQSERTIEPLSIYIKYGKWYVEAYCHLREEERTFALRRMDILEEDLPDQSSRDYADQAFTHHDTFQYGPALLLHEVASRCTTANLNSPSDTAGPVETATLTDRKKEDRYPVFYFFLKVFGTIFAVIGLSLMIALFSEGTYESPKNSEPDNSLPVAGAASSESVPAPRPPEPLPAQWTYRGYRIHRSEDGTVSVSELEVEAKSGRMMHYLINASFFINETGVSDEELLFNYISADTDKNGHLSWQEVAEFQRRTYRSFTYANNSRALPPDEFLRRGGGDCEDFALYTCGMLRFWGWNCKVASYYPPDGGVGHALALVWSEKPIRGYGYIEVPEGIYISGREMRRGYWIPIDYDRVGAFSEVMASDWKLWNLEEPQSLYWRVM